VVKSFKRSLVTSLLGMTVGVLPGMTMGVLLGMTVGPPGMTMSRTPGISVEALFRVTTRGFWSNP
jgi:purine-cytosine permease-like protein